MSKKTTDATQTIERLKKETRFCGLREKPFTVGIILVLAILFVAFPSIVRDWLIPCVYPLLREGGNWPIRAVVFIWYCGLFILGYWAWGKRRRMQEVKAELERRQKENHTPQS
jgi:hypothetical protein